MENNIIKPNIIVICGPTCVGKTTVAIQLAEQFGGEIISADSMQIYRHMTIGTAKPRPEEQARIRHYMIDIVNPDESFDAGMFTKMGHEKIIELNSRGVLPFVVGGTGLYIKSLLHGLFRTERADPLILDRLRAEADQYGTDALYKKLITIDPEAGKRIHPNDIFRIIRALEIFESTGRPISEYQQDHGFGDDHFNALKICLNLERQTLYDRVDNRVDQMIGSGLIDEVKGLLDMGYSENLKPMQSIGYRHITAYIRGQASMEETVETMKRDTRRYAKRQLTWFRADQELIWADPNGFNEIKGKLATFLQK